MIFKQCLPCNSSSDSDANLLAVNVAKKTEGYMGITS